MKHVHTFEGYGTAAIANVQTRGGQYIVMGITGGEITRRSAVGGEMLVGFSTDMIVIQRGLDIFTYTPTFNQIARRTLAQGDAVRAVVGPNILIYRASGNFIVTYDRNFRELQKYTSF
jgi:hypothetical protein